MGSLSVEEKSWSCRLLPRSMGQQEKPMSDWLPAARVDLVDDPYVKWVGDHLEDLRRVPNQNVAIHLQRGVVLANANEEEFARALSQLSNAERAELFATHTSLYV